MTMLRIDDLLANAPVDPEAQLDVHRVERYSRMIDTLLPVVFATPEGMLLADGYHRVAAARVRGLETVEAEVRRGSRHDALRYAATVGAAERGISPRKPLPTSSGVAARVFGLRRTAHVKFQELRKVKVQLPRIR
jgi:hypothetical protein